MENKDGNAILERAMKTSDRWRTMADDGIKEADIRNHSMKNYQ